MDRPRQKVTTTTPTSSSIQSRSRVAIGVALLTFVVVVDIYSVHKTTLTLHDTVRDVQQHHRGYTYTNNNNKTVQVKGNNAVEDLVESSDGNSENVENSQDDDDDNDIDDKDIDGDTKSENSQVKVLINNVTDKSDDDGDGDGDGDGDDVNLYQPVPEESEDKEESSPNEELSVSSTAVQAQAHILSENDLRKREKTRMKKFKTWFDNHGQLIPNADDKDVLKNGPILDFAVVGMPKCGTTTVMANLAKLAPMPIADLCYTASETVESSYKDWYRQYNGQNKTLHGTKCPQYIQGDWLVEYSEKIPQTKLIMGIRHPVSIVVQLLPQIHRTRTHIPQSTCTSS